MSVISDLAAKLNDPSISDTEHGNTSDQLAAAIDAVMRGPAALAEKIEAVQIVEARGWDALLPGYLSLLAGAVRQADGAPSSR